MLQKAYNFFIIYKKGKINSKIIFYYILYFIIFRLHLNLNPDNIVITPGGQWKLCGFGFSLAFQPDEYLIASPYFIAPPNKYIPLEPDMSYIAPELTKVPGGGVSVRYASTASDFFSLGVTAYEIYRYNLKLIKENKINVPLLQVPNNTLPEYQTAIDRLSPLDTSCLPPGVIQLILGMLQLNPASRVTANDFVNNSFFHSGPISVLRSLDHLHHRDIGI